MLELKFAIYVLQSSKSPLTGFLCSITESTDSMTTDSMNHICESAIKLACELLWRLGAHDFVY